MFTPLLSIRVDNNDPDVFMKITSLWIKALGMPKVIDLSKNFYGVFHNYEGNYEGPRDLSISVKALESDPSNNLIVLGKKYREFTVGETSPDNVYRVWRKIWELEEKGELNRQYDADYEEYRPDFTAAIFISIK